MKTFKQIDLRLEKRWIWCYSTTMIVLSVFILTSPVYARTDRPDRPDNRPGMNMKWLTKDAENRNSEHDSLLRKKQILRFEEYYREHLLLLRKYYAPVRPYPDENQHGK